MIIKIYISNFVCSFIFLHLVIPMGVCLLLELLECDYFMWTNISHSFSSFLLMRIDIIAQSSSYSNFYFALGQ